MDNNEVVKVHIWELPEKTDEIDKANNYTIIHDGVELKKVAIEKLYEYFNQDYKIENVVLFFETLMSNENKRLEELYEKLELSIEEYKEIVIKLIEKFLINRGKLRELETNTNKIDFDIEDITKSFESIGNKHSKLLGYFEDFGDNISEIETINESTEEVITKTNESVSKIISDKAEIEINNEYISSSVKKVSEDIDTQFKEKGELLIKNINDEYDRIVSIIDHYHHIHDKIIL